MKPFKILLYTFFILTFTGCDRDDPLICSPCNLDYLVKIIVEHISRENYPVTVYFDSADDYPMVNFYGSFSRADSAISLEDGGWKIEDDGKNKKRKYNTVYWCFFPYLKEVFDKDEYKCMVFTGKRKCKTTTLAKELVGKERKVEIVLLDKDHDTIFENYISVAAVSYKAKTGCLEGYTLYDTKKLEVADTSCLTHPTETGKHGNCYEIFFDLNK